MSPATQCWRDRNWSVEKRSSALLCLVGLARRHHPDSRGWWEVPEGKRFSKSSTKSFSLVLHFFGFPPFLPSSLGEDTVKTHCPKNLPLKSSILKCQEGDFQPHHLGGCSCEVLPAGKGTPGSGCSAGHRAGASPSSWGMPGPVKPFISHRGSPALFLAALCVTWAGAAVPGKEGARPSPAPGGEGQQKTAESETPGHPSLPSELELQETPGCPFFFS